MIPMDLLRAAPQNSIRLISVADVFQNLRNRQIKRLPRILRTRWKRTGAHGDILTLHAGDGNGFQNLDRSHLDCRLGSAGG